jgi:putative ABC transport system permease protein
MTEATLVRKNLFRRKLRASLLLVSILIAFLIFGALGAIYNALTIGTRSAAADRLVTTNRINFTVSLPFAYWARAAQVDGVRIVTHASWFGGYYQQPQNFVQSFAVDPESYLAVYPEILLAPEQREAFLTQRTCLLVGRALANQYGWSLGSRVPLMSSIWRKGDGSQSWEFDICAIYDTAGEGAFPPNAAMFHYDYYNEALAFNRDMLGWMVIGTVDAAQNDRIAREIDALFANSPAETSTATEAAFNQAFIEQFGNIALILTLVIGAAFLTILMIVGTTMVMAVNQRIREIAVMKTLGFTARRIFAQVLGESLLLSLLGGLLGVGLAALLIAAVTPSLGAFLPGLALSAEVLAAAVTLMVGFGLLTGLIPALIAMRVRVADALGKV